MDDDDDDDDDMMMTVIHKCFWENLSIHNIIVTAISSDPCKRGRSGRKTEMMMMMMTFVLELWLNLAESLNDVAAILDFRINGFWSTDV